MRRVPVFRGSRGQAGRGKNASRPEFVPASPVDIRPPARRLARRNLDCVAIIVQAFNRAVHRAEAERLAHKVFIGNRFHAGVLLVPEEPDARTRRVVLGQPLPPLFPRSHIERDQISPPW